MRTRCLVIALLAGALIAIPAQAAQASFGVAQWTAGVYSDDYTGPSDTNYYTQAGGHPFTAVTDFTMNQTSSGGPPDGVVKNLRVDIPPGLISNPQGVPQCSAAPPGCPADTQLGIVKAVASLSGVTTFIDESVYNMVPPAGQVSDFAFNIPAAGRVDVLGGVRSASDDGLYFTIAVPTTAPLITSTLIFWGIPSDPAHDPQLGFSCVAALSNTCPVPASGLSDPAAATGEPFISLPSDCVPAGQISTLTVDSTTGDEAQKQSITPVPGTGCAGVPFDPSVSVTPQTTKSDAPTGVSVDLHVPQSEVPNGLASSQLQNAVVTLPPGMTLNPSGASGLKACSPAQFGHGSDAPPTCPAASQIGTVEIDTPLLPTASPLTGSLYLGCDGSSAQTPCPASTGFAYMYVYATAPAQGITQKLIGTVTTDPGTGQVTTTFANQPQIPFTDFKLNLNGGPTAPIANPLACGAATTTSSLTPYSGNAATGPTSTFTVDSNGAGGACSPSPPFGPGFSVSTQTRQAGAFDNPLTIGVTRADGQPYLSRFAVQMPPGLLGLLAKVPECPEPQASLGTCPAASQIGTTTALAGSGPDSISQQGPVYLTSPYAGAPFGLSIVVPAVAGPFDLGTLLVRAAINVDRNDAHVTITSDPLPQIVGGPQFHGGIPLRLRSVSVTIDRGNFIVNPTSCAPLVIGATITSAQGAIAPGSSPFQATGCGALPFAPGMRIALSGNAQTTTGGHPKLIATVTSSPGQANVRSASVTLPLSLALDPLNTEHVCSVAASDKDSCPANTIIGSARITTPLLSQPLTGDVYLVQGIRTNAKGQQIRTLPAVLVTLRGRVALDLRGQTSVDSRSRLVTTFPTVPDAALSSFALTIAGGRHGILVVTGGAGSSLCHGRQVGTAAFAAQSGARHNLSVGVSVPCAKRAFVKRLKVKGQTLRLLVAVPAAGRVSIGGPGLASARRRVRRARTISLTVHLTHAATVRLHSQGRLRTRARIHYTQNGWPTQTIVTRILTIRS